MKIAFLSIYSGLVNRGVEIYVKELAERLAKAGYDVTVFQGGRLRGNKSYKVETIDVDLNWKHKDTSGSILSRLLIDYWRRKVFIFSLKSLRKIHQEKFDVIIPTNGAWQAILLRAITWLWGGKIIISGQSGPGWDDRVNLWTFPDVFIALSSYAKKWAKKVNPFIKVEYIPNGVDLSEFRSYGKSFVHNLEKPVVLCVGALTNSKRIELVVRAVAKLKNTSLLVAGDGILKDDIVKLGKGLLGERFYLTKVTHDKMPDLYRAASVFTLPSASFHSFEIVLTEAMATNLPVIANDDSIRREIVGEAGILVNPEDRDEYAKAIKQALEKNWGNKPRLQAEKFSWDNITRKYQELFDEIKK